MGRKKRSAKSKPGFKPALLNHFVLVYNDGTGVKIKKGKPTRAIRASEVRYFESKKQAKKVQEKHPELGLMKIVTLVGMEEVE